MSWPWEKASIANPFWPTTRYAFMWPFAHTCQARCAYCYSYAAVQELVARGDRWWTDDQAVSAWERVYDRYGPCYLLLAGLEPGEQLELISRVLAYHYGSLVTKYDAAGRMTVRQQAGEDVAYFVYDEAGNRLMMQDKTGVTYWAYDALDRSMRQEAIP